MAWKVPMIWDNTPDDTQPLIYIDRTTTVSGVATFNLPLDGSGNAFFSGITEVIAVARTDTSSAVLCPVASVKLISGDLKTITVNAVIGTTLLALGATVSFAPDGTPVDLIVMGY